MELSEKALELRREYGREKARQYRSTEAGKAAIKAAQARYWERKAARMQEASNEA